METIYHYEDATGDNMDIDMLPKHQHGEDAVMFTCNLGVNNVDPDYHISSVSVIIPMDEVVKVINRLTIELDVIAHRPTRDRRHL